MAHCPDHPLNTPYVALLAIEDGNGSPVTSGVTGSMSLYVFGPNATTTAVSGPTTMTHFGGGQWGVTFAASVLGTAGYYRYTTGEITFGSTTLAAQSGGFTVGVVPPEYTTLRQLLVRVAQSLSCGEQSTTDASGSTTTLKDARWYATGYASNEFVGDEILFLEPGAVTDPNPVRVTGFDPTTGTTGTLTFTPAVMSTVSGQDYLLIRAGSKRLRYQQLRGAIDAAIAALATRQPVSDQITVATVSQQYEYTLPTSWLDLTKVEVQQYASTGGSTAYQWETVPPLYWRLAPDRRTFSLDYGFPSGYPLRLTGVVAVPEARDLTSLVKVPWPLIRDWVVGYFSLSEAQRAGLLLQQAQRARYQVR